MSKHASLCEALCACQLQFPPIRFDATAQMPGNRTYRYASLTNVLNVVRPVLASNGICLMQFLAQANGIVTVTTRLWFPGEILERDLAGPMTTPDFKGLGGAATYLSRYQVTRMLAIGAEDDVDAAEEHHTYLMDTARAQGSSSAPARQRTPEPATTEAAGPAPTPPEPAASGGEAAALPFRGRILDHRTGTKRNGQPWCKIRVGNQDGEQREYWVPPKWVEFVANNKDEDVVWLCSAGAPRDGVAALSELYYVTSTGASVHPDLGTIPF